MRRYETTYILRPNLGEEQFSEIIERTNDIVTKDGGTIINLERWGTRKLAYEIKKESNGQYIYFDYAAAPDSIKEMERIFKIDDRVLRFLTVKLADDIDEETVAQEKERATVRAQEKLSEQEDTEKSPGTEDSGSDEDDNGSDEDEE